MLYSKSTEYAIQAVIYLAEKKSPKPIMISEIAKEYHIPQQFLAKIIQTLVKHHIITAIRGRNGGILLARPAEEIYLYQIVQAIDGPPPDQEQCVIGLDTCSNETPCPLHHEWDRIRSDIRAMLAHDNLADLAERVIEKRKIMRGVTD